MDNTFKTESNNLDNLEKIERKTLGMFFESVLFEKLIAIIIVVDAISLGVVSSSLLTDYHVFFNHVDSACVAIFCVEILLKMLVFKLNYFKSPWNVIDLVVVSVALIPQQSSYVILRAIRMLRVLRLVTGLRSMRRLVNCILISIPGVSSIIALLFVVFYIGSVITTHAFGNEFPDWFGTIGTSMYTLFQVMTLESWSMGIVRPVMDVFPLSWMFFIPFIVISAFTVLNLFIAIIVDAMSKARIEENSRIYGRDRERTVDSIESISDKINSIERSLIDINNKLR